MWTIIDKLIWLLAGVFSTHVGHFIYQKYYAEDFATIRLSESIAMIFEDLLQLLLQFLDKVLPLFIATRHLIIVVIALLICMTIFFIWFKTYTRIKNDRKYDAKIKEAETIVQNARKEAAAQMQKIKAAKRKLITELKEKEKVLQKEAGEKLVEYVARIKKLEKERLELKELNGSLMRRLKTT